MACHVCVTCGLQYPFASSTPLECLVCEDDRQYVGSNGQQWTTREEMLNKYENKIKCEETGLFSIYTEPSFAIGQRAFLVQTSHGNILWDCISLVDQNTIDYINQCGGLTAIAISHPHFFATMVDWSHLFGNIPIYLHKDTEPWVVRPDKCIHFWDGSTKDLLGGKLKLIHTGGHFEGSQVLYWPEGASHRGVLLTGDEPHICMNSKRVTFMHSFPNYIPLNERKVKRIMERLQLVNYDRLYGAFSGGSKSGVIHENAQKIVQQSGERYLKAISND
ncbi:unnamed protein product [Rotaria sp. Silwood1]|nr:unnamed protein product [Rotaria sp. Silwood1]CAF1520247.1 unnamed protein product [Rotaria sp. Silwood1]CAF3672850.1 unnamed protein product [Rotaria sp. Silwood1]CAF3676189.1 unnamed protein product [Rotaria sp. Silwood1]CAF3737123.1 unnamed protein product [Rotaria sp. Silwood1]